MGVAFQHQFTSKCGERFGSRPSDSIIIVVADGGPKLKRVQVLGVNMTSMTKGSLKPRIRSTIVLVRGRSSKAKRWKAMLGGGSESVF